MHNDVSVIAETAEFANDIDKGRAQKAKEAAEAALASAQSEEDKTAAKLKLAKAVVRLTVAEKAKA
jgi:F0F1-type ATP synthase epsilon subunit